MPPEPRRRLDLLPKRPGYIVGDPMDLVHIDWSEDWDGEPELDPEYDPDRESGRR